MALLDYDPETGLFRWRAPRSTRKTGQPAGWPRSRGYIGICIDGKTFDAHRLAVLYQTGAWPSDDIDHINGDKSDNRWQNLRPATRAQNHANKTVRKDNKLGVKGVYRNERGGYRASIQVKGKVIYLGSFATIEDAAKAYAERAAIEYGEFARW